MFINRSLVDLNLNLENSLENIDEEGKETEKYETLYQGNAFTTENYDFTNMQSMLNR